MELILESEKGKPSNPGPSAFPEDTTIRDDQTSQAKTSRENVRSCLKKKTRKGSTKEFQGSKNNSLYIYWLTDILWLVRMILKIRDRYVVSRLPQCKWGCPRAKRDSLAGVLSPHCTTESPILRLILCVVISTNFSPFATFPVAMM